MRSADLSLHVLVKDEADLIGRLLDSMHEHVGEMIVVDTGSTDDTMHIARLHTPAVFSFPLDMNFGAARNFALTKATKPWIFHVDADEWVTCELLTWLKTWDPPADVGGLRVCRHNLVGGMPIGEHTFEYLVRVFRQGSVRFINRIHEYPLFCNIMSITETAPAEAMLLHHKSVERQERQNAFYQQWEEQRAIVKYP